MRRALAILAIVAVLVAGVAHVAAGVVIPTLSELERLTLANRVLAYRNAQLELEAYLRTVAREGFDLDVVAGVYVPKPAAKAAE